MLALVQTGASPTIPPPTPPPPPPTSHHATLLKKQTTSAQRQQTPVSELIKRQAQTETRSCLLVLETLYPNASSSFAPSPFRTSDPVHGLHSVTCPRPLAVVQRCLPSAASPQKQSCSLVDVLSSQPYLYCLRVEAQKVSATLLLPAPVTFLIRRTPGCLTNLCNSSNSRQPGFRLRLVVGVYNCFHHQVLRHRLEVLKRQVAHRYLPPARHGLGIEDIVQRQPTCRTRPSTVSLVFHHHRQGASSPPIPMSTVVLGSPTLRKSKIQWAH